MKKLAFAAIPLALLAAWGGVTWYISSTSEDVIRQYLEAQNQHTAASGIRQELVSYEKGLFRSKAITKVVLEGITDDGLQLTNRITHGPLLFGGKSLFAVGMAKVDTELDLEALSAELRESLKTAFAGKPPAEATTIIGFGGGSTYNVTVNPFKIDDNGVQFSMDALQFNGDATADMTGKFAASGGKFTAKSPNGSASIPGLKMDGNITGFVAGQMLGTLNLDMPGIHIEAAGTTVPTRFDLKLHNHSEVQNDLVSGKLDLQANNIQGVDDTFTKLQLDMRVDGLALEGLQEIQKLQTELQTAQGKLDWSPEALETPEGQQQQEAFARQIEEMGGKVVETLFNKTLQADKSRIQLTLQGEGNKGKLNGNIDLTYTGQGKPDLAALANYTADDWGKLLKGKLSLDADKGILPEGTEMALMPAQEQGFLKLDGNKITSLIELQGETVNINGKQMRFGELFQGLGAPSSPIPNATEGAGENSLGIPPDLMKKLEEEGPTPELIQLLEESDDVSPETVEMIKQLQQLAPQEGPGKKK